MTGNPNPKTKQQPNIAALTATPTDTTAASMRIASTLRAQWFWTLLSSLNNSKPVGDCTPIVPRRVAPHLGQSAPCSPTWLPHFQQYTIEFPPFPSASAGVKLNGL